MIDLSKIEIEQKSEPLIPDHAEVQCINNDCGWRGTLGECRSGWEQESWETERYQVALCPKCLEEVEIL